MPNLITPTSSSPLVSSSSTNTGQQRTVQTAQRSVNTDFNGREVLLYPKQSTGLILMAAVMTISSTVMGWVTKNDEILRGSMASIGIGTTLDVILREAPDLPKVVRKTIREISSARLKTENRSAPSDLNGRGTLKHPGSSTGLILFAGWGLFSTVIGCLTQNVRPAADTMAFIGIMATVIVIQREAPRLPREVCRNVKEISLDIAEVCKLREISSSIMRACKQFMPG